MKEKAKPGKIKAVVLMSATLTAHSIAVSSALANIPALALADSSNPNPYGEGTTKVRLTPDEKASLMQYADSSKSRLEQALQDGQGKGFAEANEVYLRAIKAVVMNSFREKPRSELLMRVTLNQALELTFGVPTSDGNSAQSAGILQGITNHDLLTVILEDSIKLSLSFYQDDRTAIQNGSLTDLPYMKQAVSELALVRNWQRSVTEPVSKYELSVAGLQHFLNTAANEDQQHRALYAEELTRVDELLQENPADISQLGSSEDAKTILSRVRVLRGETRRIEESAAQKLAASGASLPVTGGASLPGGTNAMAMSFESIPGGTFLMGSPSSESGRYDSEVQHKVTVHGFGIQVTDVTQAQYVKLMGVNPSNFALRDNCPDSFVGTPVAMCPNHPVEEVSWNDAQAFIDKLNSTLHDGYKYRLPTEAEWEYAARAGTATAYSFGPDSDAASQLTQYAWYSGNSESQTHDVAKLKPNGFGLYDMTGNVWQWVQDRYGDYPRADQTDPTGPASGSPRVLRGGGWSNYAQYCRSAFRGNGDAGDRYDALGFRLVRTR